MCFFKKKKTQRINSKYQFNDQVNFRYKGEMCPGYIFGAHQLETGEIVYDIQIGGECPAIIKGVKEVDIIPVKTA